jgi:hypothetical protein
LFCDAVRLLLVDISRVVDSKLRLQPEFFLTARCALTGWAGVPAARALALQYQVPPGGDSARGRRARARSPFQQSPHGLITNSALQLHPTVVLGNERGSRWRISPRRRLAGGLGLLHLPLGHAAHLLLV